MNSDDLMSVKEAQRYLGVSKVRMTKLVEELERSGKVFQKKRDTRFKWVRRSDIEALKQELDEPSAAIKELAPVA